MADASDTRTRALLQPGHLPPAGRHLSGYQHRRGALLSLAGLAAGAAAAPAQVAAPDPVLALVSRAEAFQRQGDALAAVRDSDGASHFWGLKWDTDDVMLATQPTTMAGLIHQMKIVADRLEGGTRGRLDAEDVWRLAGFAEVLAARA